MIDQTIQLVEHQAKWRTLFLKEKTALELVLTDHLVEPIEHVGSTAVEGLMAKPTIDIMIGVESLTASKFMIDVLANLNYCYAPYKTEQMHWFCKPSPANREFHLHLIPLNSKLWHDRLFFRDKLRQSAELKTQYQSLKQKLAVQFANDRDQYSIAKTEFIQQVLALRNYNTN